MLWIILFHFTGFKMRYLFVQTIVFSASFFSLSCSTGIKLNDTDYSHNIHFKALSESANSANWNPAAPWVLAEGFRQKLIADESALNIYDGGRNDWHDMNTVNESGLDAGRYLYRTHEIRNAPEGGAISVVDLKTGVTKILAQNSSWNSLDGIRWTPWGTLLVAEEITNGRFFEIIIDPNNPTTALEVIDRPSLGRLAHEGIEIDSNGNIYVVDEHRGRSTGCAGVIPCGGGIYKFVPDRYADLSSGNLYVLGFTDSESNNADNTGQATWLGPVNAANARLSGTAAGGASYQRPEDLEIINNILYVAITEGPLDANGNEYYEGRVISINLDTMLVSNFVKPGLNVAMEIGQPGEIKHQTGFDSIDNLAEAPDGSLVMIEDNKPSDIWFASTKTDRHGASTKVKLFASLTDPEAEGSGIYISHFNPNTLYVNVQHSAAQDGDATWAIRREKNAE